METHTIISELKNHDIEYFITKSIKDIYIRIYNKGIISIIIWYGDIGGVEISSSMVDIEDRVEVGVLVLRYVRSHSGYHPVIMPSSFREKVDFKRMIINVSNCMIDSGLIIESENGDKIFIMAASMPYTLTINAPISNISCEFSPEYPIEKYTIKKCK